MEDNYTFNVDIETQKSTTSVASLRKEVKDLKDQLLNLEEGTESYNRVLQECANKTHALKEMQEEVRASAADVGERLGNMSRTLAGVSGGVQVVTSGLSLMGVEMGKDNELMKTLMSLMSMTQGFQAIDSGVKAFARLTRGTKMATIAQQGLNLAVKAFPAIAIGAGIGFVVSKLIDWANAADNARQKQKELNDEIQRQNQKQYEDAQNEALDEFLKGLARRRKELEADGKSRIEIERQVRKEVQEEYDKQAATLRDANKQYRQYREAREKIEEYYAKRDQERGLSRREKLTRDSTLESLDDHMDDVSFTAVVASSAVSKLRDVITDLDLDIRILGRDTKKAKEEGNKAEKDTTTWLTILNKIKGGVKSLEDEIKPELAEFWSSFASTEEDYIGSWEVSDRLKKLLDIESFTSITQEEAEQFWKGMLDGNDQFLTQYEQRLIEADEGREDQEVARLEREKKLNAARIQILQDEIEYYKFTANAEDDYLQQTNRALIASLENEQKLLDEQIKLEQYNKKRIELETEYLLKSREIQNQYGDTVEDFWTELWEWQYQNQWDSFQKQYELNKARLEAEKAYQEQLATLALEQGDQDTLQAAYERLAEITDELNNLDLSKSKATFKAWGDSVVKILGNVTSVMGSLMSYYATVTDEAVADLEDKLNEGLISQEEYDAQSEKLKEEQFERNKQFQIAQALINGAAGIVQIIGDASLPSYWAKLAAIAATTLTTGIEIAAIQAQHYHGGKASGGSSSGSGNGENWINVAPAYQMNDGTGQAQMTGAALGEQLNSQRVYILESDIQSSNRRVQVRESNTRF